MQGTPGRLAATLCLGLASLAVVACLEARAWAQAVTGTILGTVRDATGAALPHATVTLTHVATGLTRTANTGAAGAFAAPLLPTGAYTVSAEAPSFKKTSVTGVLLGVDQKVRVDLDLEVGALTESVLVQSENPLLQTTTRWTRTTSSTSAPGSPGPGSVSTSSAGCWAARSGPTGRSSSPTTRAAHPAGREPGVDRAFGEDADRALRRRTGPSTSPATASASW